ALVRRAVEPRQLGLGIERVDVARRAVHEQEHAMLRLGREMLRPGGQRAGRRGAPVARQQVEQRQRSEYAQKFTSPEGDRHRQLNRNKQPRLDKKAHAPSARAARASENPAPPAPRRPWADAPAPAATPGRSAAPGPRPLPGADGPPDASPAGSRTRR